MNLTTQPHLGQMLKMSEATLTHFLGVDTQNFTFFYLLRSTLESGALRYKKTTSLLSQTHAAVSL